MRSTRRATRTRAGTVGSACRPPHLPSTSVSASRPTPEPTATRNAHVSGIPVSMVEDASRFVLSPVRRAERKLQNTEQRNKSPPKRFTMSLVVHLVDCLENSKEHDVLCKIQHDHRSFSVTLKNLGYPPLLQSSKKKCSTCIQRYLGAKTCESSFGACANRANENVGSH